MTIGEVNQLSVCARCSAFELDRFENEGGVLE